MRPDDTIAALSSGQLPSGIAVIRVSGSRARAAMERLAGGVPSDRRASLRRFRDREGETIDRGVALYFAGPGTVTGEDLAEFHLHGGRAVVAAFLDAVTAIDGVRLAEPGEYTRRAFENGRIDLTEAEGLGDLISAVTEGQRQMAIREAGGALKAVYEGWMQSLTQARAMLEASFDFADEGDVGETTGTDVAERVADLASEMRAHLESAHGGEILREGYKVAIVGAPNVGKSSLLNALADRDVAIVADVPGTTRDVIEVTLDLGGILVRLSDTAGIRETDDTVEKIGVERARAVMDEADLILALADPNEGQAALSRLGEVLSHVKHPMRPAADDGVVETGAPSAQAEGRAVLAVRTKMDRADIAGMPAWLGRAAKTDTSGFDAEISVKTGQGIPDLVDRIATMARQAAGRPGDAVPIRARHRELIVDALRLMDEASGGSGVPAEVTAETLRRASDRLGALTGRVGVEDLLDVIFSRFCIGK